jgi:electron transport complex protein RnfD
MTTWLKPFDSVTSATPLGVLKYEGSQSLITEFGSKSAMYIKLFFGNAGGSIGETSAILLLAGGLFLIFTKIIDFKIPLVFISTVVVASFLFGQDPVFSILAGGVFLGAFFMATDYVTSPITKNGRLIFAFGCGLLTVIIRMFSGMPEGVCYAILLMNAATPIIDRLTLPKPFGYKKKGNKNE